jgi:DNA-binding IclR family transcriptional regulator
MNKRYAAPSVRKAFNILRVIADSKEGKGLNEIAKKLAMAKSTAHGITSALEEIGAIVRDSKTKKFTLGYTLFELGRLAYAQVDLKDSARPVMEELMKQTQTSVFLGVLNWDHITILDIVESMNALKITVPIGSTIPVFAGATGKVFFAWMDPDQVLRIIETKGITQFTENSMTDPDVYMEELKRVKKIGYAIDDEEYLLGVRAVASPIMRGNYLLAALWAVGFKANLRGARMDRLVTETRAAAEKITQKIENQMPKNSRY